MTVSGTQARYELTATANPESARVTGGLSIGTPLESAVYTTNPNIVYSMTMRIAAGVTLTLNTTTGVVTGTVAGANQVETATVIAASGCAGNGNATVVFSSDLIAGSPITTQVALTTALTTASAVAGAIRTALQAVALITAKYTIGGTGANIVATATDRILNDAGLNISTANGTCTGLTSAPSSVNTTAGAPQSMAYRVAGTAWDAKDAEGFPLLAATKIYSVLIRSLPTVPNIGATLIISAPDGTSSPVLPLVFLTSNREGLHQWSNVSVTFTPDDNVVLYIDIHAGT